MGFVFVGFALPSVLAGPIAGAFADRFAKRDVFLSATISLGLLMQIFPLAYTMKSMPLVFVGVIALSMSFSFLEGPFMAYLPELFEKDKLPMINSAMENNFSMATIIGPALGGVVLAAGNITMAFVIDSVAFLVAALFFLRLPLVRPERTEGMFSLKTIFHDAGEGIAYIFSSRLHRFLLLSYIVLAGTWCLSGALLMPLCEEVIAKSSGVFSGTAYATIQTCFGIGGFVGSFFVPVIVRRLGFMRSIFLGGVLWGIQLLIFGLSPNLYIVSAVLLFTAFAFTLIIVPIVTLLQEKTEERYRGRAMSVLNTIIPAVAALSFGLGGIFSGLIGIRAMFIGTGLMMFVGVTVLRSLPGYRLARDFAK